jgi:DNA-binding NtrC family response regulator
MTGPARILVVDDDESIRKVLATVLEERGYIVDVAENGKEAIKKSFLNFYNLALIDIRLPDMEGVELLTGLKETTPRMIKVIITGYPSLQNTVDAVNKGADGYLIKPFDMKTVLNTTKELLEKQQKERRYSEQRVAEFIETRVKELKIVR